MYFQTQAENKTIQWVQRVTDFVNRWVSLFPQILTNSRFFIHLNGKLRRFFLVHFRKTYVHHQLSARRGACRQCGVCCNLLFTCPALTKNGRCLVYGTCRPAACRVFPIDQRDIKEVRLCGSKCGYHFSSADSKNSIPKKRS